MASEFVSQMARQLAEIIDRSLAELLSMKPHELAVFVKGQGTHRLRLPDYLADAPFHGLWDHNPFFTRPAEAQR